MRRLLLIPLLVALSLSACSDDDDNDGSTGPDLITIEDLAGTWAATLFRAVSLDDPAIAFELIAAGGSMDVIVQSTGAFTGEIEVPDPDTGQLLTIPIGGSFTLESQTEIYADFAVEIPPFLEDGTVEFEYDGNTLALHQEVTTFDFDNDGVDDPATFDATLVRQ
jgi:hypothetical protein